MVVRNKFLGRHNGQCPGASWPRRPSKSKPSRSVEGGPSRGLSANSPSTGRPSSFSPFLSRSVGRGHGGYKTSSCSAGRCFCWFMRYISADTNDSAPYLQWSPQGGIGVMRLHRSSLVSVDHGARLAAGVRTIPALRRTAAVIRIATSNGQTSILMRLLTTLRCISWRGFLRSLKQEKVRTGPTQGGTGMLRLNRPDQFPYAVARHKVPDTYLPTASPAKHRPKLLIALPPPGEASACRESPPGVRELLNSSLHRAQLNAMRHRRAGSCERLCTVVREEFEWKRETAKPLGQRGTLGKWGAFVTGTRTSEWYAA